MRPDRLLLLLLVLYLVWRVLAAYGRHLTRPRAGEGLERASDPAAPARPESATALATCPECGVAVPRGRLRPAGEGRVACERCAAEGQERSRPGAAQR